MAMIGRNTYLQVRTHFRAESAQVIFDHGDEVDLQSKILV